MTAWGGHPNGRIPTSELEYVGIGVRSGQPQYLHPTVAQAWRNLQAAFRAQGVNLLITEGYRTLALQQVYWDRKQADPKAPAAARPGTSNHGWGTAVDMAGYLALPANVRRPLIEAAGFSLETGDRVREPWHIEYVHTLTPAETEPPVAIPPTDQEGNTVAVKQNHTKQADGRIIRALHDPGTGYWLEWTETGSTYANAFARQFNTGNSVAVTPSLFNAMRRAALRVNPRDQITVETASGD